MKGMSIREGASTGLTPRYRLRMRLNRFVAVITVARHMADLDLVMGRDWDAGDDHSIVVADEAVATMAKMSLGAWVNGVEAIQ